MPVGPAPVRCASVPHHGGYLERDDHQPRPDRALLADDAEYIDVDDLIRESEARNDEDDPRDLLAELERVGYIVRDSNGNLTLNRTEPPEEDE